MRFATDNTLGKLGRYLRAAGFDTLCQHEGHSETFFDTLDKDRIILTRTTSLKPLNRRHRLVFVRHNDPLRQLEQVVDELGVRSTEANPFSRCLICNRCLVNEDKMYLEGRVPVYVWHRHHHFRTCHGCQRVYWAGTHRQRMQTWLEKLFKQKDAPIHADSND